MGRLYFLQVDEKLPITDRRPIEHVNDPLESMSKTIERRGLLIETGQVNEQSPGENAFNCDRHFNIYQRRFGRNLGRADDIDFRRGGFHPLTRATAYKLGFDR